MIDEETGMELKDDHFDVEDEMLQDENAISGKVMHLLHEIGFI